ncbi:MAG: hypothetical protein HRU31_08895 [Rhodobacteraceae bacterium]|nr:hypothetical protein [Paracoccaceae bacterium]
MRFYALHPRHLAGRTRPERASWLIWSVLGSIFLLCLLEEGGEAPVLFACIRVGGAVSIFAPSIFCGLGCYLSRRDAMVLGVALTVVKAYRMPETETLTI